MTYPTKSSSTTTHPSKPSTPRLVRFLWLDLSGITNCKAIPESRRSSNCKIAKGAVALLPWTELALGCITSVVGEASVLPPGPDFKAYAVPRPISIPWLPSHSFQVAGMFEADGTPWSICPRATLIRALNKLKEHDLSIRAGFELEFQLFSLESMQTSEPKAFGLSADYTNAEAYDMAAPILNAMISTLEGLNMTVIAVHAEGAKGQFEIVLDHKPLLEAVDELMYARLAIKHVAREFGYYASFIPTFGKDMGNGSHVHLSLENHFGTDDELHGYKIGMSKTAQSFMQGIVRSLPWLTFLLNSSVLSYIRARPMNLVGVYQIWGMNNKEAPVRVCEDRTNFEIKLLDAMSNAYLALAGVIMAGISGVSEKLELEKPCQEDPPLMDEAVRPCRLPDSMLKSVQAFEQVRDARLLSGVFEDDLVHDLIVMKKREAQHVEDIGIEAYQQLIIRKI